MDFFLFFLANILDRFSRRLKRYVKLKKYKKFVGKYGLQDSPRTTKKISSFNPYEPTDFYLIDELVNSKCISKDNSIYDIGCGTGLFLAYLADNGFTKLSGIEFDEDLYALSCGNAIRINKSICIDIHVICGNAIEEEIPKNVDCFYFFNTFNDKETYLEMFKKIYRYSLFYRRSSKVIILFPTIASLSAIRDCRWLKHTNDVLSKTQACWRCMYFKVYEIDINN